jgi:hypothetical protein
MSLSTTVAIGNERMLHNLLRDEFSTLGLGTLNKCLADRRSRREPACGSVSRDGRRLLVVLPSGSSSGVSTARCAFATDDYGYTAHACPRRHEAGRTLGIRVGKTSGRPVLMRVLGRLAALMIHAVTWNMVYQPQGSLLL